MAFLRNKRPRLISLNTAQKVEKDAQTGRIISVQRGEVIDLKPAGGAVEVPDALVKTKYVQALVKQGDVELVDDNPTVTEPDDGLSDMNKDELTTHAELLGVELKSGMTKDQIKAAIREATDQ